MENDKDLVIINALMRQALVAVEEVMGKNGLVAVLRASKLDQYIDQMPPDDLNPSVHSSDYARLNEAIESLYGRGGKGILQRVGKASFQYGLREQSAVLGLAGLALKVLPPKQRILLALNSMANALRKTNSLVRIIVEESDGRIYYIDGTCSICCERHGDKPLCYLYVGTLGEAVRWATGQVYQIRETECRACGADYCRFEIGDPAMVSL